MQPIRHNVSRLRRQSGISNLQITIGILIGSILVSGGILVIRQIEKAKVDNEVRELARLKKKGSALAAQRGGSFNGVTQQGLVSLDFFSDDLLSGPPGARAIRHQWSGEVSVTAATMNTPWDALDYRYTGVSTSACKQLGMQAGTVASGIKVQGTWVKSTVAASGSSSLDLQKLISLCTQGSDNATMNFYLTK